MIYRWWHSIGLLVSTQETQGFARRKARRGYEPSPPEISAILARHIRSAEVPAEARAVTQRAVMDAIGVMSAASGLGEGCEAFAAVARESGEGGPCTVLGFDFRTSPIMAAFANGAMAHALDFEDTHDATLVHPHAAVVPAALALAEFAGDVSGRDFLDAVAIGADISCRLALGLTESVEKRGFYFIPMLSAYGAAAAAARILKLSESEIVQSLALASCQAVFSDALVSYPPSHLRAVRDGFSARAGVTCRLACAAGPRGLRRADRGTRRPLCEFRARQIRCGAHAARSRLRIRGRQGQLQAMALLPGHACFRRSRAIGHARGAVSTPQPFERIDVKVSPFFSVLCEPPEQKRRPKTAIDAKFSIPFTVAVALAQGDVGLQDFSPSRLSDPKLHAIADIGATRRGARLDLRAINARIACDFAGGRTQLFARGEQTRLAIPLIRSTIARCSANSRIALRAPGIHSLPRR